MKIITQIVVDFVSAIMEARQAKARRYLNGMY